VGLTARQFRRLRRSWEVKGYGAVIHGLRGRRSNRVKSSVLRERAIKRAKAPVLRAFGPTLLAEHLSRDDAIGPLSAHTLRNWMIDEGLWKAKRIRARHRKARTRRAAVGELIQWDSSEHAWFEDRAPGRCVLIQMHDDATNRLFHGPFCTARQRSGQPTDRDRLSAQTRPSGGFLRGQGRSLRPVDPARIGRRTGGA